MEIVPTADIIINFKDQNIDSKILDDIFNIKLQDSGYKMTMNEYYTYICRSDIIASIHALVETLYDVQNKLMLSKALLYAYYINQYTTELFYWHYTQLDRDIIEYAGLIVKNMEKLLKTGSYIGLNKIINIYYSYYRLWIMDELLTKLEDLFIDYKESLYNYQQTKNITYLEEMITSFTKSLNLDPYITLKIYICNYNYVYNCKPIEIYFWNKIKEVSKDIYVVLTLLIEIRAKLINITSDIKLKKQLYYDIDIDNITNKLNDNSFKIQDIISSMYILIECMDTKSTNNIEKLSLNCKNEDLVDIMMSICVYIIKVKSPIYNKKLINNINIVDQ